MISTDLHQASLKSIPDVGRNLFSGSVLGDHFPSSFAEAAAHIGVEEL